MFLATVLFTLIVQTGCSYKDRITITTNFIKVKYYGANREHILDTSIFHDVNPDNCSENQNNFCLKWGDFARLQINKIKNNCENYEFKTIFEYPLKATFNISGINLYGGSERSLQAWPTQKFPFDLVAYVSQENNNQALLESYWLDSEGNYVYVDPIVPLFASFNKTTLEIIAKRQSPYIRGNITILKYRLCTFRNVKIAHEDAIANVLGKPHRIPDFKMVQYPLWSTWAEYKTNISMKGVAEFADSILQHGFINNSQLEINDKWEICYGSLRVDRKKFPNMKELVSELSNKGFKVTIWLHPFINQDCNPFFQTAKDLDYFVKTRDKQIIIRWWNGYGGFIDFTNSKAASWWQTRVKALIAETGIDSYYFDAGESSFSPETPVFHYMNDDHPEQIVKDYVDIASTFGNMISLRVGRKTQRNGYFVRMTNRKPIWTGILSIATLIPELLHMNIIGYSFVLPDAVGGREHDNYNVTEEMFIRWLQICVFMPALQFSVMPWHISQKTTEITKKYVELHTLYAEKIYSLMTETSKTGAPVNRPLWWIDPTDPVTHTLDSGDDILIAPVITEGATKRDIYLPKGFWKDENIKDSQILEGPLWLKNYEAELDILPYFSRVTNNALLKSPVVYIFVITSVISLHKSSVV